MQGGYNTERYAPHADDITYAQPEQPTPPVMQHGAQRGQATGHTLVSVADFVTYLSIEPTM